MIKRYAPQHYLMMEAHDGDYVNRDELIQKLKLEVKGLSMSDMTDGDFRALHSIVWVLGLLGESQ